MPPPPGLHRRWDAGTGPGKARPGPLCPPPPQWGPSVERPVGPTADSEPGGSGSGKKPRSFVITKEVQGAVGNALIVLKLLLASAGGELVFEYRPGTRAPAHGASSVFLGRLEGDQVVAVDGALAGCRFPSLCVWARVCKEELTGKVLNKGRACGARLVLPSFPVPYRCLSRF